LAQEALVLPLQIKLVLEVVLLLLVLLQARAAAAVVLELPVLGNQVVGAAAAVVVMKPLKGLPEAVRQGKATTAAMVLMGQPNLRVVEVVRAQ
jgi:hypothetical protein